MLDYDKYWRWLQRKGVPSHTKWKIWRDNCAQNFEGDFVFYSDKVTDMWVMSV